MAALLTQRELLATFKQETLMNLERLHAVYPLPAELHRQLFKEDVLEKPNQHVFMNLSHYLICIITPKNSLPWPLYDTNTERAYKKELFNIITQYQNTGLVSPVMASYFVNPGCFKVIKLVFQLCQLTLQSVLQQKIKKDAQKKLFRDMLDKYKVDKSQNFNEIAEDAKETFCKKISHHINFKNKMQEIAEKLKLQIIENETEYNENQKFIDDLIDKYIVENNITGNIKIQIEAIKNVEIPAEFFKIWLQHLDSEIKTINDIWESNISLKLLKLSKNCAEATSKLIARHTGEEDKKRYCIEYEPSKDIINTKQLEAVSNAQQRYILKNIVNNGKLNFPFLIRGFIVAVSYILKDVEIDDDIYKISEYLGNCRRDVGEALTAARVLTSNLITADAKIQLPEINISEYSPQTSDFQDFFCAIPPLPDLTISSHSPIKIFDSYTPLNIGKRNFNIRRHNSICGQIKTQPKALLNHGPRDDFLKSIISCRLTSLDKSNQNTSMFLPPPSRINETVSDCCTGFSKTQIMRLLSTKKKSSSKKQRERNEEQSHVQGKRNLFDASVESISLVRSHSSPNLYENRERRNLGKKYKGAELSTMQENSPSFLELSGISALGSISKESTPIQTNSEFKTPTTIHETKIPTITVNLSINTKTTEINVDCSQKVKEEKPKLCERQNSEKGSTPNNITRPIRKSTSIEKIIKRFIRVRAPNIPSEICKEIEENIEKDNEKENQCNVLNENLSCNRNSLPDLLSPSCSLISKVNDREWQTLNFSLDTESNKKPRESLGTVLGVDNTFLDQFDFID